MANTSTTENIDTIISAGRMTQIVGAFAEFARAMICKRIAEGCIGGRQKKLDAAKCREIADSVTPGHKLGAEMTRLYNVSAPTVSRIVAAYITETAHAAHAGQ